MTLFIISELVDSLTSALAKLFGEFINKILIGIVGTIYSLVYYLYQIFLALANVNVFDGKVFDSIISKMYIVLGIITLFALAYNLLNYIIDPTKNKSGSETWKVIKNVVISFILIVLCPFIFKYMNLVQTAVLEQNTIGQIFSSSEVKNNKPLKKQVALLSRDFFRGFFSSDYYADDEITNKSTFALRKSNNVKYDCRSEGRCTLEDVDTYVAETGDFAIYKAFALNVYEEDIDFDWFIGIAVGLYVAYVILSFCFDMAIRQIKLIFYQILAPICISCRIVPKEEKVFKNWLSAVFKTYMSVFVRMVLLVISVLLISYITNNWNIGLSSNICKDIICSPGVKFFAKLFLIIACITFLKQGTKMICELFGFDDVKISMKGKLKDGGAFMAGSAISSGITNASRKGYSEFSQMSKGQGFKSNFGHFAKGVAGVGTGFASGAVQGGKNGANADSFSSMNAATKKTMEDIEKRKRQKIIDKSNGDTTLKRVNRWFTGTVDNAHANEQIYGATKGITDSAKSQIESDANKNKAYNYGIPNNFGGREFTTTDGKKVNVTYSADNLNRILNAKDTTDGKKEFIVSDEVTKDGKVIKEKQSVKLDTADFEALVKSFTNTIDQLGTAYKTKSGQYIDFTTQKLHEYDQLIAQGRMSGKNITVDGMTLSAEQLSDVRNAYLKQFSEIVAEVASKTPDMWKVFMEGAKDANDGRETLAELYRQGLDLRTLLEQNQNADIVKELRKINNNFDTQHEAAFQNAITKDDLKFFKGGLLSDIKKANNNVQNMVSERMYEAKTAGGNGDKK